MNKKIEWVVLRLPTGSFADDSDMIAATPHGAGPGASPFVKSKSIKADALEKLSVQVDTMTVEKAKKVAQDPTVLAAGPRIPFVLVNPMATESAKALPFLSPAKKLVAKSSAGSVAWGIDAVGATTSPFDGTGIKIAVLDTGIDKDHPAFKGVTLTRKNFTSEVDGDINGHGTHCAGTIFGRDIAGTRIGVARGVKEALIGKVLGEGGGASEQVFNAIAWARSEGAHIISISLGMDFVGYCDDLINRGFDRRRAISIALSGYQQNTRVFDRLAMALSPIDSQIVGGSVLVAAAGNESDRPDYSVIVAPPASAEMFVSVGAVAKSGKKFQIAPFSNERPVIAAPGVAIASAKVGGGLMSLDGTSMAAPHVAGVAALWAQKRLKDGAFSARQVYEDLKDSAIDLKALTALEVGAGLVQAPQEA